MSRKRKELSILAAVIAAGCVWGSSLAPVEAAADSGVTSAAKGNYVAMGVDKENKEEKNAHVGSTMKFVDASGEEHQYTATDVDGKLYWVRKGYGINVSHERYFDGAKTDVRIDAYKIPGAKVDSEGLVSTNRNGLIDTADKTVAGGTLHKITYTGYMGVTNTGGIETPAEYNYKIQRNGQWVEAGGGATNLNKNFKAVNYDTVQKVYKLGGTVNDNGSITGGTVVPFENVYNITTTVKEKVWVDGIFGGGYKEQDVEKEVTGTFVTEENGDVPYLGPVYGANNEVLVTAKDANGHWHTVWGAKTTDPNATIGNMRVATFEQILKDIHDDDVILSNADIKGVKAEGNKLNFITKDDTPIDAVTVTTTEIKGKDTKVTIAGSQGGKLELTTGSRVDVNGHKTVSNKLTGLTVNGQSFDFDNNKVLNGNVNYTEGTLTIAQGNGVDPDSTVKITGVHDYYTTGVKLVGDELQFSRNDGSGGYKVKLDGLNTGDYQLVGAKETAPGSKIYAGEYKVAADGSLTLNIQDSKTKEVRNVKLTDIASITAMNEKFESFAGNTTINNKIAAAKTEVVEGDGGNIVVKSSTAKDGHTIYSVAAKNMRVSGGTANYEKNGAGKITLNFQDNSPSVEITGLKDTYVNSAFLNKENNTLTLGSNVATDPLASVDLSSLKTQLAQGENITLTPVVDSVSGQTTYTVAAKDTTLKTAGEGATKVSFANGKLDVTIADTDNHSVTGSADIGAFVGEKITANNNNIYNEIDSRITNNNNNILKGGKLTFAGDSGNNLEKHLGDTVTIKGGAVPTEEAPLTNSNIGVVTENGAINVKLASNLTNLVKVESKDIVANNSITVGGTTIVNGKGITINGDQVVTVGNDKNTTNTSAVLTIDNSSGNITMNVKDSSNNTVSGTANIAEYVGSKAGQVINNTEYTKNVTISGDTITVTNHNANGNDASTVTFTDKYVNDLQQSISAYQPATEVGGKASGGVITTTIKRNGMEDLTQQVDISDYVSAVVNNEAGKAKITINKQETTIEEAINNIKGVASSGKSSVAKGSNINVDSVLKDGVTEYTVSLNNAVDLTAKGSVTIGTAKLTQDALTIGTTSLSKNNLTVNEVKINGADNTLTGLSNITWDSEVNGKAALANRAATEAQLRHVDQKVIQNSTSINEINQKINGETGGLTFVGDGSKSFKATLGDSINIVGGKAPNGEEATNLVGGNIGVQVNAATKTLEIKMASDLTGLNKVVSNTFEGDLVKGNSINVNNNITVGGNTENKVVIEGGKITIGDKTVVTTGSDIHVDTSKQYIATGGTVSVDLTNSTEKLVINDVASKTEVNNKFDTVNNKFETIEAKVGGTISFKGDTGTASVGLGQALNVKGGTTGANTTDGHGKNLAIAAGDNGLEIKLAEDISELQTITFATYEKGRLMDQVKIDGTQGTITGLSNTKWNPKDIPVVGNRAATEAQLENVDDRVIQNAGNIATNVTNISKNAENITNITDKLGTGTMNFTGDNKGGKAVVALDGTLNIAGGAVVDDLSDGNNVGVVASGDGLKVKLSKKLSDIDSIVINQGGDITIGDINVGESITNINNSITNVLKDGKLTFAGDDKVNKDVALGGKFDLTGGAGNKELSDGNIGVIATDTGLVVKLAKDVTGLTKIESTVVQGDTFKIKEGNTNNYVDITYDGDNITIGDKTVITNGTNTTVTDNNNNTWTVNQKGADGKDNKVTIKNNFIENASYADGKLTLAYNDASMQALSVDLSDLKGEIAGADFRLVGAKTTDKGYTGAYEVSKVEGQEGTIELNVMSKDSAEPEKIVLKDIASKSVVDNQFTEVNKKVDTNTTNITNITDKLGTGTMNFTGDNEGGKAVVALDGTLNIAGGAAADELSDGNNVGVVASGDGLKVKLSKKLSDIDSIVINQGGDITIGDINVGDSITKINNSITNVLKDGKMTFTGDDGQAKEVALGGELGLTGGLKDAEKLTDNNIGVIATDKGLAVKLAKDVAGLNSITSTTINGDTINSKVINVTNENGDTVKIEGDKITINNKEVITGGSENFITGDDNVKVVKTDNGYGLSLGESITVGGANKVTVNGADGVITGLTNTKWDKNNTAQYANSSKAATEAQLHQATKDAIDSAKGNDFRLVGDGDDNKGAYNVDDATGKVSLKVQDNHGNVENVIIEDIASKTVVDGINETVNKHTTEINAIDKRVTVNEGVIKGHTTIINELDKKLGEAQLSFTGDNKGGQADVLLNEKLNIAGGADTTKLANGANIGVVASADGLKLNLAKDITGLNSITTNNVYGDTIHIKNGDKYEEIKYIDGKITIGGDTIITGGGTTSLIKGDKNITIKNTKDGYNVSLNDKLDLGNGEVIIDGSAGKGTGRVQVGGSYMNKDGFYVNAGPSMTVDGINAGKKVISNVAAGKADTDAVNVGQLNQAVEDVKNSATANDQHIKGDEYAVTDNKVSMDIVDGKGQVVGNVTIKDVASTQDITNVNNRIDGLDQKVGDLNDLDADIKGDSIVDSLNKVDGRLDKVENDITDIKGDISNINKEITDIKGEAGKHSSVTGSGSIDVSLSTDKNAAGGNNYEVSLKDDVNINNSLTVGGADGVLIQNNAITGLGNTEWDLQGDYAGSDKAATEAQLSKVADSKLGYDIIKNDDGTTTVDKSKVTLAGGKDKDGKAIGTTITNLAAGKVEKDSTDAINGSQLWETNQNVANNTTNIQKLSQSISSVNGRVSKAAAGAAALAALHPLDFDPDDKLSFAAGVGNYGGSTATSIGAFYHPTEKVMLNVAGTYGNGENMVNMGVAFALDKNNNVSNSRVAMAKEIVAMREHMAKQDQQIVTQSQQIAAQNQQIAQLVGLVNRLTGNKAAQPVALAPEVASPVNAMFPDVAENHWAYEYVAKLAQAGVIDGYPDGSFYGDRTMTRYEFATMLYKAMAKGAQLDTRITDEFKFELGRIRVDLIKGEANSANSVERVRVNTTPDTNEYGDKILVAIDK